MKTTCGIFLLNKKNEILVEHPTNHDPNFWSIPKGNADPGEKYLDAALREFKEETDLDLKKLENCSYIKEYDLIKYKSGKKQLKAYLYKFDGYLYGYPFKCESMVTYLNGKVLKNPFPECDDFKWVTIDKAMEIVHETQVEILRKIKLDVQ
jgi:8-oxo-dGTP pyrophosphatase MutT (NUDIX family)